MKMRILHRYLGFFLAGIMSIYALSGVVLIFRNTDFLKSENAYQKQVAANLTIKELSKAIEVKGLELSKEDDTHLYFEQGKYEKASGLAEYKLKELPFVLRKMVKLHKARSGEALYVLNIFFGFALLFFVVSSFFMFPRDSSLFKRGMIFAIFGAVLTLVLLFI